MADKTELIEMGRSWLEYAPTAKPGPVDLLGYTGPVGFVCSTCAGRILGRGCNLRQLADVPVWTPAEPMACALCLDLKAGDVVRYSRPQTDFEATCRFTVLECFDGRVTMQMHCREFIKPIETVAVDEVTKEL